jgi:hypothetical protein
MENSTVASKVSARVEKVFRSAKEGDRIAYLTYGEQGGIFRVSKRTGVRGIGGTITLSLEREQDGQLLSSELDMRRDGPSIATMSLLRDRKPRTKRVKAAQAPAESSVPANDSASV